MQCSHIKMLTLRALRLDQGLNILNELLLNVGKTPNISQGFYQQYLLALIQDVFAVMTDRLHKSGFKMHATLLRNMFHLVQTMEFERRHFTGNCREM